MGKTNIDFIERFVVNNSDCSLIKGQKYTGAKSKLRFLCKCGEEFETTWDSFKSNTKRKRQCNRCGIIVNNGKSKMSTIEEIKNLIEESSECTLVSKEYYGTRKELELRCNCGEHFNMSVNQFNNTKYRCCTSCRNEIMSDKYNEKAIAHISTLGYKVLSPKCLGINHVIDIEDNDGYRYSVKMRNLLAGGVPEVVSTKNKYSICNISLYAEKNSGSSLLSDTYINSKSKLNFKCSCGNEFSTSWNEFSNLDKRQCNECGWGRVVKKSKIVGTDDRKIKMIELLKEKGFTPVDYNFKNVFDRIGIVDREGYKYYITIHNVLKDSNHKIFSKNNKFRSDNIKNFIKINNLDVKFIRDDNKKLLCECKCGNQFSMTLESLLKYKKDKCKTCTNGLKAEKFKYDISYVKKYITDRTNGEYQMVSPIYVNNRVKIDIKHLKCGNVFSMKFGGFVSGYRCPTCSNMKIESTHASVLKQIFLYSDEFGNKMIEKNSGVVLEDRSCINTKTGYSLPTDIVDYNRKIVVEVQSMYHDNDEQKGKDEFKKKYWEKRGFKVYQLDHRDYSIIEMINVFYKDINDVPYWIAYDFSNKLDINAVQTMISDYYTYKQVSDELGVSKAAIQAAICDNRVVLPDDYFQNVDLCNQGRCVVKLNMNMEYICEYSSANKASLDNEVELNYIKTMLRRGKYNVIGEFVYAYKKDYERGNVTIKINKKGKNRELLAIDFNSNVMFVAKSQLEMATLIGVTKNSVQNSLLRKRECRGLKIVYKDEYYLGI